MARLKNMTINLTQFHILVDIITCNLDNLKLKYFVTIVSSVRSWLAITQNTLAESPQ